MYERTLLATAKIPRGLFDLLSGASTQCTFPVTGNTFGACSRRQFLSKTTRVVGSNDCNYCKTYVERLLGTIRGLQTRLLASLPQFRDFFVFFCHLSLLLPILKLLLQVFFQPLKLLSKTPPTPPASEISFQIPFPARPPPVILVCQWEIFQRHKERR